MTKIEELLNVLDLPEKEQCKYLSGYFTNRYYKTDEWPQWYGVCDILIKDTFPSRIVVLADLAFRLRDEVVEEDGGVLFGRGMAKICFKIYGKEYGLNEYLSWCATKAQPIHWILASLIAKELSKASEDKE